MDVTDMHLACGAASGNSREFRRVYQGSIVPTTCFEYNIHDRDVISPSTSKCNIAHHMGVNHSSMLKVLNEQQIHLYHHRVEPKRSRT
jgi:hypothetical protein